MTDDINELEILLKYADVLAMAVDIAVQNGTLNSRSQISDARLNYGQPFEYKHLTPKEIEKYQNKLNPQNL